VIDRVFGTRYRLIEKIGIGGMAEVFKATDEVLGRTVAVKVMLPQYASDPTFAARFKQEAQSAANLASPYIVNIYDWGHEESDNTYFIVMEYVRGTDLKTAIQQRGAINQRKAAEIGSQVCAALSVAHGYDIIHRDIKPHNIMVQPDGNAKVMDFGIARANGSAMTQTGSVLGTAYYVSPEQAQGKPLTPATDLYSLGIVLYEATTGRVPFDAPDAVAVALKQVNEQPVPPSHINPDIDQELEAIILRAMSKSLQERYTTAEQMRTALNNYLAGRPIDSGVEKPAAETRVMGAVAALPVINRDGAQPPAHTAVMPSVGNSAPPLMIRSSAKAKEEEKKKKKRQQAVIIGVIVAILAIAAIGVGIYLFTSSGDSTVEVPDVVNLTEEEARVEIEKAELKWGTVKLEASDTVEEGKVISTKPSAKTKVKKDTEINLTISSGPNAPEKVSVPNLRGMTPAQAKDALKALNLNWDQGPDRNDNDIEVGIICAQDIEALTEIDEGSTVTFYLSKGKETGTVVSVIGEDWESAASILENAGFVVEFAENETDDAPAGSVIRQNPSAGTTLDKGKTVTLTCSDGPAQVSVPDLTGLSFEVATTELQNKELKIARAEEVTTEAAKVGKVIRQDPDAGTPVGKGSTVTVYIGIAPA
jgi:serine/threonine-protein kinase